MICMMRGYIAKVWWRGGWHINIHQVQECYLRWIGTVWQPTANAMKGNTW